MKIDEFMTLIKKFSNRPIPGRKFYIYQGSRESIKKMLPSEMVKEIDLLQLLPNSNFPDDNSIQRAVKSALKDNLQQSIKLLTGRQILLIISAWILVRYRVPPSIFYQYYLSDKTMVIVVIERTDFHENIPAYVTLNNNIVLNFFRDSLPEENKNNILQG